MSAQDSVLPAGHSRRILQVLGVQNGKIQFSDTAQPPGRFFEGHVEDFMQTVYFVRRHRCANTHR